jgi:hypothetical protein
MGLADDIEAGNLFPTCDETAELSMEALDHAERWHRNHPSFEHGNDSPTAPGTQLLQEYLDKGFCRLFSDAEAASSAVGGSVHPAPLGLVSKEKPDGTMKHRIIQDLRRNEVNTAMRLPERTVLPRPIDHAVDVARLSQRLGKQESCDTFVLDYKDAFMSIPIAATEARYNTTMIPSKIRRTREALDKNEPLEGTCLVDSEDV